MGDEQFGSALYGEFSSGADGFAGRGGAIGRDQDLVKHAVTVNSR